MNYIIIALEVIAVVAILTVIIEVLVLLMIFAVMILLSPTKNPTWWMHDYSEEIQEE